MAQSTMSPGTVADAIMRRLRDIGIEQVFGVHGANVEDLYVAALATDGLDPIVAKHEFSAGTMADGAARITGVPAVVMTTSGGGAMNVVPALAESYDSRVPVLALIGAAPTGLQGRGAFQDMLSAPATIDAPAILGSVSGLCLTVTDPGGIHQALDAAEEVLARNLPVVLIVPKDVQWAPAPVQSRNVRFPARAALPVAELETVAAALTTARGAVVVLAGDEAARQQVGAELADLVDAVRGVLAVTPGGRDTIGPASPTVGVAGVMGHLSAATAVSAAAVVLVIGSRLPVTDRAGLDLDGTTVIHLGAEQPTCLVTQHIRVTDLKSAIELIVKNIDTSIAVVDRLSSGIETLSGPARLVGGTESSPMTSTEVVEILGGQIPEGANVFADAGNVGAAAVHHLPVGRGGRFLVALGMGGMGYAFGAAIGAAMATGRRSVVLAGDGAFFMHGMEIHTAIEHRVPLTVVIFNNDAHGMCVTREQLYFPGTASVNRFRPTDFVAGLTGLFPGLPVHGAAVRDDLATAADTVFAHPDGPNCLVVQTDPDEMPPFAPFVTAFESLEENR